MGPAYGKLTISGSHCWGSLKIPLNNGYPCFIPVGYTDLNPKRFPQSHGSFWGEVFLGFTGGEIISVYN